MRAAAASASGDAGGEPPIFRGSMGGTPKWLVYEGTSHLEMDDLRVPLFQETSICSISIYILDANHGAGI